MSVALVIQHEERMRLDMSSVACLAPSHVFTLLTGTIFGKMLLMCVQVFSTIFILNVLVLRIIQRDININVKTPSCKVPVILVMF